MKVSNNTLQRHKKLGPTTGLYSLFHIDETDIFVLIGNFKLLFKACIYREPFALLM